MSDPFLGEIRLVPYNFEPRGWAFCAGQTLPIAQNTALFSLLGTTYGGNGQTTFKLPDLQGRVPISSGAGPGLTARTLGETPGAESVTLTVAQLPAHDHGAGTVKLPVATGRASTSHPDGAIPAAGGSYAPASAASASTGGTPSGNVASTGGGQAVGVVQPGLVLNYIIALQGIFPSRN